MARMKNPAGQGGASGRDVLAGEQNRQPFKPILHKPQTFRAELVGSNTCAAAGVTARGNAPVLALCRELLAAGLVPGRALEVYLGATLALTVRSIGEGARLTVKEPDRGRAHFAPYVRFASSPVASPMRLNARPLCRAPAAIVECRP